MFGIIRRVSYGLIPRPDRPWEEDREFLPFLHSYDRNIVIQPIFFSLCVIFLNMCLTL